MIITAHIDISTPSDRKIVRELALNKKNIQIGNPLPVGVNGLPIKTYTLEEAENMIWDQMSEFYGVDIRKL